MTEPQGTSISNEPRRGNNPSTIADENQRVLAELEEQVIAEVDAAAEEALRSRNDAVPAPESTLDHVYALPPKSS